MKLIEKLRSYNSTSGYSRVMRDAADEIERLQRILDSRPAINAGLPDTYIEWSQGVYMTDMAKHVSKN